MPICTNRRATQAFLRSLCALLLATSAAQAQAGWTDALFGQAPDATTQSADDNEPARRVWPLGEFSWVRLIPADVGTPPNQQPATVSARLLERLLGSVQIPKNKSSTQTLFSPVEAAKLASALSEALANAGPNDDILLQSAARRTENSVEAPTAITARLFMNEAGLQLLVQTTRFDYYDRWRGTGRTPDFPVATRNAAGTSTDSAPLTSTLAINQAANWLSFPLSPDRHTALLAPLAATPPPAATGAAVTAPKVRDAAFFNEQAQRLAGLKSLRDKNLITEAEYQQKRNAILQGL